MDLLRLWLQPALAQTAIALSVFSLITYLWLGLTVLLIGNRGSRVTWIGGVGLLLAALFFLCHGALVDAGIPAGAAPSDFWWHLLWVPSFAAPIFWAAIGLHYADLVGRMRRLRVPILIAVGSLGGIAALLALLSWHAIEHYGDFIRLLSASLRLRGQTPPVASPLIPALGLAFIIYIAACAGLPWASLAAHRHSGGASAGRLGAAGDTDGVLLWDAADAWTRAHRALLGASLCMVVAGGVAALVGIAASLLQRTTHVSASANVLNLPPSPPGHLPLPLVAADVVVQGALAGLCLLLGWAVVQQGVLVERRLPQRGFFRQWRGTVFVALLLAAVVGWMGFALPEALPALLVLVALVTTTYALFTWQSYGEHDRLLAQLRPFVASLSVGHAGWLATDPADVERNVEALFTSLCRDVLGAASGRLSLTAGRLHRTFTYTAPVGARHASSGGTDKADRQEWALPVMDERGVVAQLVLGLRVDGAGYTSTDLEIARACGQRILDAVGEFAAAQAIASLARRRGLEAELSAALPRRVLHDDVLPRLHLAMLRLEALRSRVAAQPVAISTAHAAAPSGGRDEPTADPTELGEVVGELGHVHHDLATLMRAAPAANPRRVEHGLVGTLRSSLEGEFRGTFDALEWEAPPDATAAADRLPPIVADLLLGAALEAVRNAGRHARGDDLHRRLELRVAVAADDRWVTVSVADDGVGLQSESAREGRGTRESLSASGEHLVVVPRTDGSGDTAGGSTRTGLLTHGALVALVGGTLSVRSRPGDGTTVTIRVLRVADTPAADD
ncbi:MAG TPA: ATP-binding protein [Ktedonobacterales bacterium]|nr:ATP-binding protein [Ktedonobacterales bacterium]